MNKLTKGSNMRWESSRMMLPEHVKALREERKDLEKIERPYLDEQELEELGRQLNEAIAGQKLIELHYFKEGFIKQKICYPDRLDPIVRQLKIRDLYGMSWNIAFKDIVDVKLSDPTLDTYNGE